MANIQLEFERLASVLDTVGVAMKNQPGATTSEIQSVIDTTGVSVCDNLQALWRISNGSKRTNWFAEGDCEFASYYFLSTTEAIESWKFYEPYDAKMYKHYVDEEDDGSIRGPMVQPRIVHHRKWLSFAELNGGSHQLLFDDDPTTVGHSGQIINFTHDPDRISWLAANFLEFFSQSNNILEEWLESPDELKEHMFPWD